MIEYTNGNVFVSISKDGTKTRKYPNNPQPLFPESIDIKITNYCDLNCKYCHEMSTKYGNHANLDLLLKALVDLPAGVEFAIGGGNPLSHPGLIPFLLECKNRKFIVNITINQSHIEKYFSLIVQLISQKLVYGVGVSISNNNFNSIKKLSLLSDNIVFHLINGVHDIIIIDQLLAIKSCKILILGYKQVGRGINFYSDDVKNKIKDWYMYLPKYIGKCIISFDNLAIEQLKVNRLFTTDGWEKFYMGDDFTFSMYIDAVKEEYAQTSRSGVDRASFKKSSLLNYFQKDKKWTKV